MGVSERYDAARAAAARCPTVALRWRHRRLMHRAGRHRLTRAEAVRLLAVRSVLRERRSTTGEAAAAIGRELAPMLRSRA